MPPRIHRLEFVPSPFGLAHVAVDQQGRFTIPTGLREVFRDRTPPFGVAYSLAAAGRVTVHPADCWPAPDERDVVAPVLAAVGQAEPTALSSDHLQKLQDFLRVVACRYLDGSIAKKWQITLPAPVRAWLGVPVALENSGVIPKRRGSTKARPKKGPQDKGRTGIVVVGNLGALELWNEAAFQSAVPTESEPLSTLTTEVSRVLKHTTRQPSL